MLEYTLYSQILQKHSDISIYMWIFGCIGMYAFNHMAWMDLWLTNADECSIVLPYQIKSYTFGLSKIKKIMYSEKFLAVNHYVHTHSVEITSLIETANFENTRWHDDQQAEYILLPTNKEKIVLCNESNIYLEITVEKESEEPETQKDKSAGNTGSIKKYTFHLTKKGKSNLSVLSTFLDTCMKAYQAHLDKKPAQMIYEYTGLQKDDDNHRTSLTFQESAFHSNKTFDNVFLENKAEILAEIREFSKSVENKGAIEERYKRRGIPFKKTYVLHGPPGCGKSSLIKAFINETGRHCILVRWSLIKTASDFAQLCHLQYKKITQRDVILVFEDFDANASEVLKIRKSKPVISHKFADHPFIIANKDALLPDKTDELTLESILNTLDGIKELYDTVIVFTTNVLDTIDPAFLRPGRIDKIIYMDYIRPSTICSMLEHFYPDTYSSVDPFILKKIKKRASPAKVQQICQTYPLNIYTAIAELQ